MNPRKTDLTGTSPIFIGETIVLDFPSTATIKIIDAKGNEQEYFPNVPIDTSQWAVGVSTAIITDGSMSVQHFTVKDPLEAANKINQLQELIDEIDQVIEAKVLGGSTTTLTINNKTLVTESAEVLYRMRQIYAKKLADEKARVRKVKTGNPIKSITRFTR